MSNSSRMLALVFGGALFVGVSQSVTAAPSLAPATVSTPVSVESCDDAMAAADDADDDGYEVDAAYECPNGRPYCRRASQCEEYCAGGAPVCSQGCCACAS